MSTGGGNERDTVGGVEIPILLTGVEECIASLLRRLADLRNRIGQIPIDFDVVHGGGQQIQKAAEEAAQKWKLSFQALAAPADLSARFASIRNDLEIIASAAEKANQAISITVSGPRGRGNFAITGKGDVATLIEELGRQGPLLAPGYQPGGDPLRVRLGTSYSPDSPEARAALGRVESGLGAMTQETIERQKSAKASKDVAESGEKLSKWLELWSSGGRPQRAIASLMQGPMTGMFGVEGGAAMAGLFGMVGGGALFHVGWAITDALSRIPEGIGAIVDRARTIRMTEAMGLGQGAEALASAASGRGAISQFTGKPKEFQAIFNALQTTSLVGLGNPEEQGRIATLAAITEWWRPDAGKAGDIAQTIQRMRQTGTGRQAIGGIPFVMDYLVKQYEASGRMPPGITGNYEQERAWILEKAGQAEFLPGSQGRMPNPGSIGRKEIESAWQNAIRGNPILSAMLGEQTQRTIMAHWWEANIMGFESVGAQKFIQNYSTPGRIPVRHRAGWEIFGDTPQAEAKRRVERNPSGASDADWALLTGQSIDDIHRQRPYAELMRGNIGGLANMGAVAPGAIWQPSYSFSSLSGFANKMQTEAGAQIDYAQDTASNTAETNAILQRIESKLPGGAAESQMRAEFRADVYEGSQQ